MSSSSTPDRVTDEVIQVNEQYYILATSPRADEQARVLKHADTFAVFDRSGDIQPAGMGEEGIYHDGTRFLSRFRLLVNDRRPLLLSSTVREDNLLLTVDLTNPDYRVNGELVLRPRYRACLSVRVFYSREFATPAYACTILPCARLPSPCRCYMPLISWTSLKSEACAAIGEARGFHRK